MDNQDKKRELIIEAATRRFAHFGLAKTTMTEIASDLSLSKALLYYYFPDKLSLYAAVLESIIQEINAVLVKGISKMTDSEKALLFYLDKRHEYIVKYYNILDFIRISGPDLSESLVVILENARSSEIALLSSIIKIGVDAKHFHISNTDETASLLMDAFMGMRYSALHNKQSFQLQNEQFCELLERQKQLGRIFLKGLR